MFAPADNSICVSAASPFDAAQCNAVMPSPCAPFTSAPLLSSALTAAASRAFAASATSVENALTTIAERKMHVRTVRLKADAPLSGLNDIQVHHFRTVAKLRDVYSDAV